MRTALLADIHSNLEALRACLAHAEAQGATDFAFLGDIVGYNADPRACLDIVREYAARGAVVVLGNHDAAVLGGLLENMGFVAREAIYWTRAQLGESECAFLSGLPLIVRREDQTFVHSSALAPQSWTYISSLRHARDCLLAADTPLTFAGHVHQQSLHYLNGDTAFVHRPSVAMAIPLPSRWRWLAIAGSVGQARDGHAAAAYAVYDDSRREMRFFRVSYDTRRAAAKVRAAGLPERLALRLLNGN